MCLFNYEEMLNVAGGYPHLLLSRLEICLWDPPTSFSETQSRVLAFRGLPSTRVTDLEVGRVLVSRVKFPVFFWSSVRLLEPSNSKILYRSLHQWEV